jgi:hypothetical protein
MGGIVGIIVISVGGLALVAMTVWLMIRSDRVTRERARLRLEAWEAEGGVGPPPNDYFRSDGGSGFMS